MNTINFTEDSFLDYLAGYFDGDGCVRLNRHVEVKPSGRYSYIRANITLGSHFRRQLEWIQSRLGIGSIHRNTAAPGGYHELIIGVSHKVECLVDELRRRSVLKYEQFSIIMEYLRTVPVEGEWRRVTAEQSLRRVELFERLRREHHLPARFIHCGRLTPSYLGGFMDAEGSISMSRSWKHVGNPRINVNISQKYRELLDVLAGRFGGHVNFCNGKHIWNIQAEKACRFLGVMRPFVVNKHRQLEIALSVRKLLHGWTGKAPIGEDREAVFAAMQIIQACNQQRERIA